MLESSVGEEKLKELVKDALVEVLEERRDLVRDLLEEALEDLAFVRAIEEGRNSKIVNREEIVGILTGDR